MEQVEVGYGDKVILDSLKLNLVPGSRIGLLGRNGAGKSTLIKLLANENKPIRGEYLTSAGLQIGYFAQHQLEFLRADDSALRSSAKIRQTSHGAEPERLSGRFWFPRRRSPWQGGSYVRRRKGSFGVSTHSLSKT